MLVVCLGIYYHAPARILLTRRHLVCISTMAYERRRPAGTRVGYQRRQHGGHGLIPRPFSIDAKQLLGS